MACYQHPDFLVGVSVGGHVIEEIYNILIDHLGRENLKTLITEERYWKAFVEAAELSRLLVCTLPCPTDHNNEGYFLRSHTLL